MKVYNLTTCDTNTGCVVVATYKKLTEARAMYDHKRRLLKGRFDAESEDNGIGWNQVTYWDDRRNVAYVLKLSDSITE